MARQAFESIQTPTRRVRKVLFESWDVQSEAQEVAQQWDRREDQNGGGEVD
jgi:phage tail tape-measure protein